MPDIKEMPIKCDLSIASFGDACGKLGRLPSLCHLICSETQSATAQEVQEKYGCMIWTIAAPLLKTEFTWAAFYERDWVWSPGI